MPAPSVRNKVQIHVLRQDGDQPLWLLLRRRPAKGHIWQCVTGKFEGDEQPHEAALRELLEETGLKQPTPLHLLYDFEFTNDEQTFREFVFVAVVTNSDIELSGEHEEFAWLSAAEAIARLHFVSNVDGLRAAMEWIHGTA